MQQGFAAAHKTPFGLQFLVVQLAAAIDKGLRPYAKSIGPSPFEAYRQGMVAGIQRPAVVTIDSRLAVHDIGDQVRGAVAVEIPIGSPLGKCRLVKTP